MPVDSALGLHARPELGLACPDPQRSIALATGHIELLGASVYPVLHDWLGPARHD